MGEKNNQRKKGEGSKERKKRERQEGIGSVFM
jgi:hypothetical protein